MSDGLYPEKGFIIASKVKEGESTPLKDIKGKLKEQLSKLT